MFRPLAGLGLTALLLAACTAAPIATPTPDGGWPSPQPYASATPAAPTPPRAATPEPLPAPTPQTYEVQEGDTMVGIATRFGLSLDALLAANPTVSPSLLRPGDVLQIPAGDTLALTPPAGVRVVQVDCFPQMAADTVCLALVENEGAEAVEDVALRLRLSLSEGRETTAEAFLLLDALFPGQQAPAVFYLDGRWETASWSGEVLSALPFSVAGGRYAPGRVVQLKAEGSGNLLLVSGRALPPAVAGEWQSVQVAVSAFDASGRLVGARRLTLAVSGSGPLDFHMQLFSGWGEIVHLRAAALWSSAPCGFCP